MKKAICYLESATPYSQGRFYGEDEIPHKPKENHDDYEKRTWRERCHYDKNEQLYIPPIQFMNCIKESARYGNIQIKGKGKSTYTKHFRAGIIIQEPLMLPIKKEEVKFEWMLVTGGGKGSSTRVRKCFPLIPEWSGEIEVSVLDDIITEDIFREVLKIAGGLIGVGRYRAGNGGLYGRFNMKNMDWKE